MLGNKSQPQSQVAHSATTVLRVRCRISLARTILESNILFGLVQFGQLQAFQSRLNGDQKYPRILECIHDMQLVNHLGIIIRRSKSFACFIKSCIPICNVGVNFYRYDFRVSNLACTKFPMYNTYMDWNGASILRRGSCSPILLANQTSRATSSNRARNDSLRR